MSTYKDWIYNDGVARDLIAFASREEYKSPISHIGKVWYFWETVEMSTEDVPSEAERWLHFGWNTLFIPIGERKWRIYFHTNE